MNPNDLTFSTLSDADEIHAFTGSGPLDMSGMNENKVSQDISDEGAAFFDGIRTPEQTDLGVEQGVGGFSMEPSSRY